VTLLFFDDVTCMDRDRYMERWGCNKSMPFSSFLLFSFQLDPLTPNHDLCTLFENLFTLFEDPFFYEEYVKTNIQCYYIFEHPPPWGWGRPTPTLVPWRQGFRLQQGTSVGAGMPKPHHGRSHSWRLKLTQWRVEVHVHNNLPLGRMQIFILWFYSFGVG
jgi:hypothetical protein